MRWVQINALNSQGKALTLTQRVTIPPGMTVARLKFWVRAQGSAGNLFDDLALEVRGVPADGTASVNLGRRVLIEGDALFGCGWVERELDFSSALGAVETRTFDLVLTSDVAIGSATEYDVDDIRIISSPPAATVEVNGSLLLTLQAAPGVSASAGMEWALTGLVTRLSASTYRYDAPDLPGTYVLHAATEGQEHQADLVITVTPEIQVSVTPARAEIAVGTGLVLVANVAGDPQGRVTWSLLEGPEAGTISATGAYAAPATPGTRHIVATSTLDWNQRAIATVVVRDTLTIDPSAVTLMVGATQVFGSSVPNQPDQGVLWTLAEGSGTLIGSAYTAPQVAGTYLLTGTSAADPSLHAQATITVKSIDLDGDGDEDEFDFPDEPKPGDFNSDGVVDALDVNLFLSRFGGAP